VPDGATLQLGVGTLPDAVLGCLRDRRGLRIWSEMVSDGLLALDRSGALLPGATITASFCEGSAELYAWLDDNPRVRFARSERVNDPALIARQPCMRSINTALQVDLYAQANAARRPRALGGRIYSGFGGQPDFVVGALHANGGAAIIALPSWHQRAGASTIVPALDVPATSFQPSHVVTERGVAHLACLDQREQAAALIGCADPSARPELAAAAELMGLLATPAPAHAP
jgi:acyl-CoA hydrolase